MCDGEHAECPSNADLADYTPCDTVAAASVGAGAGVVAGAAGAAGAPGAGNHGHCHGGVCSHMHARFCADLAVERGFTKLHSCSVPGHECVRACSTVPDQGHCLVGSNWGTKKKPGCHGVPGLFHAFLASNGFKSTYNVLFRETAGHEVCALAPAGSRCVVGGALNGLCASNGKCEVCGAGGCGVADPGDADTDMDTDTNADTDTGASVDDGSLNGATADSSGGDGVAAAAAAGSEGDTGSTTPPETRPAAAGQTSRPNAGTFAPGVAPAAGAGPGTTTGADGDAPSRGLTPALDAGEVVCARGATVLVLHGVTYPLVHARCAWCPQLQARATWLCYPPVPTVLLCADRRCCPPVLFALVVWAVLLCADRRCYSLVLTVLTALTAVADCQCRRC